MEELLQTFWPTLINCVIDILSAALLCFFVVKERLRGKPLRHALVAVISVVVFTLIYLPLRTAFGVPRNLCLLPYLVIAFYYYNRVTSAEPLKLLFIMLLALNYHFFLNPVNFAAYYLFQIREIGAPNVWPDVLLNACITAATLPIVMWFVRRRLWPLMQSPGGGEWKLLWTLPTVFTVLHYLFYDALTEKLYELPLYSLLLMFLGICAFFVYYIILRVLKAVDENARNLERVEHMERQIVMQGERFEDIAAHIDEMKILRHDMRHNLSTLEAMLGDNVSEHAIAYLREYISRVEEPSAVPICKNAVADAVCRRYIALAGQIGIEAQAAVDIPEHTDIADSDLAVLLCNLWENAVEACQRQSEGARYIRLRIKTTNNSFMISMTNSFDGVTRERAGVSGEPVFLSLKRGGTEEGIGVSSIRAIVKRYRGLSEYTYDAESFNAKILLYPSSDPLTERTSP